MADGLYGELQTALAMEDNSDDLRWLVCATSLLLNEDSLATSQNAFLTPASSNWGSMQSLDLPSTPFLNDFTPLAEGQPRLESWAPTLSPCQSQPEWMLLSLHLNAVNSLQLE